ncbi:hypothetical protein HZC09_00740 [Candidatus Micrarchaeota archaeon]|nr:hypothetical protein [Candidatus Micrarchaeota archaeon]
MKIFGKEFTRKHALFIALFAALVVLGDNIKLAAVWGASGQFFTLFQLFGPIAGAFLGPVIGAVSVLGAELFNFFIAGKEASLVNLLRLSPMLFAAYYFGIKEGRNYAALIPLACMALFVLHPVGGKAWIYTLYWLLPLGMAVMFKGNLIARSLGATFTAHAVGSVMWLYFVNPMTPELWMALIPIVAMERLAFAAGISVSYVAFNTLLFKAGSIVPKSVLRVDPRYVLFRKMLAGLRA